METKKIGKKKNSCLYSVGWFTSKETKTYTLAIISSPALYEYPSSEGGFVVGMPKFS